MSILFYFSVVDTSDLCFILGDTTASTFVIILLCIQTEVSLLFFLTILSVLMVDVTHPDFFILLSFK